MKKLLLILCLFSFTTTGFGQFWKPKPKPTPVPVRVAEAVKSPMNNLQEARKIIKELNSELTSAK